MRVQFRLLLSTPNVSFSYLQNLGSVMWYYRSFSSTVFLSVVCGSMWRGALFACFHKLFRLLVKVFCRLGFFLLNFGELVWRWICSTSGGTERTHIRLSGGIWSVSSLQVIYLQWAQDTVAAVLTHKFWQRSSSNWSLMKNTLSKDKGNILHLLFWYVLLGMGTSPLEQKATNFSRDLYQKVQHQWAAYS